MKNSSSKNIFFSVIICLLGLIFIFFVLEVFLRLFFPQDLIEPMAAQIDSEIIYTLTPNKNSYLKGSDIRKFHLKTNSLGLREKEIAPVKPEGVMRIMLLGDSVSMAEGVELEEIYLKKFEDLCRMHNIGNVETINAAIRGYGNDQELILLRRIGKKINPDIVILAFYTGNDLIDNWEGRLFRLEGGSLIQQPAKLEASTKYRFYSMQAKFQNMPGYSFIMSHSHLANWLRRSFSLIIFNIIYKDTDLGTPVIKTMPLEDRDEFYLTTAILSQWSKDVESIGAIPFIMIIPHEKLIRGIRQNPSGEYERLDLAVEKFCRQHKILYLNLAYNMIGFKGDFNSLWLQQDGHFNPGGHIWVAEQLFKAFREQSLIKLRAE